MAEYSIRDIARMAGVSVGTVSRILNNADNVSDEIRRRTLEVIRQVNYRAGRRGRRPVHQLPRETGSGRRIRTIAMLSPGMSSAWKGNELWTTFLSGIERACGERGARLAIYMADMEPEEIVREISSGADGVLIKTNQEMPAYVDELISRLPCVGFGALPTSGAYPQVVLDNHAGGAIATRELLQMGHRRIAFLNHEALNSSFIARSNGYMEVMKSAGLFRGEYLLELQLAEYHSVTSPEAAPPDLLPICRQTVRHKNCTALGPGLPLREPAQGKCGLRVVQRVRAAARSHKCGQGITVEVKNSGHGSSPFS